MTHKDTGWWEDFFPAFRPLFGIITKKVTNAEVSFILKKLNLKRGSKFLDCPCGIGRITLPLAKKGIKVTGVDITPSYLDELKQKAKHHQLKIDLFHNDMRRINFNSQFDAGGNLWTSFGYFEKESDNLLVLKKMYKAIKPGGKFLLHVINRDWIILNYQPDGWQEMKNIKVLERRTFDYATSINKDIFTYIKNGNEKSFKTDIRMYSYHELVAMFKSVGFVDIEGYGSLKEEPIDREKRMMFIIGTKPKSG